MPKRDRWKITAQSDRKRKLVALTLSDAAREALAWLAEDRGESKSEVVEDLVLRAVREGESDAES